MSAGMITYGDISPRVGIFAVAKALASIHPITLLDKFGVVTPLPKNRGEVVKWRRIKPLSVSTSNLTEGVTPPPQKLSYEVVTTTVGQFGGWIQVTDRIADLAEDPVLNDSMTQLTEQAALVKELVAWGVIRGGTSVLYSNGANRSIVNTPVDKTLVRHGVNILKRNHARKITERLAASDKVSTEPVNTSYVAVGHVDLEGDFRDMSNFIPVERYGTLKPLDDEYELGKVEEVRILLTPTLEPFKGQGNTTLNGMRSEGGAAVDVYPIVLFGKEAYGTVPLQGMKSIDMAVTNPKMGTPGDPLGQRGSVAWKMYYQAIRLNEQWMVRLEVGATSLA